MNRTRKHYKTHTVSYKFTWQNSNLYFKIKNPSENDHMKITIKAIRGEAFAFEATETTTVCLSNSTDVLDSGGQGKD